MKTPSALIITSLLLSACSTQAWYTGFRQGGENQCRQANPADAEACIARLNNKSYDEYNKERGGAKP
jgi:hypothetical protein